MPSPAPYAYSGYTRSVRITPATPSPSRPPQRSAAPSGLRDQWAAPGWQLRSRRSSCRRRPFLSSCSVIGSHPLRPVAWRCTARRDAKRNRPHDVCWYVLRAESPAWGEVADSAAAVDWGGLTTGRQQTDDRPAPEWTVGPAASSARRENGRLRLRRRDHLVRVRRGVAAFRAAEKA